MKIQVCQVIKGSVDQCIHITYCIRFNELQLQVHITVGHLRSATSKPKVERIFLIPAMFVIGLHCFGSVVIEKLVVHGHEFVPFYSVSVRL